VHGRRKCGVGSGDAIPYWVAAFLPGAVMPKTKTAKTVRETSIGQDKGSLCRCENKIFVKIRCLSIFLYYSGRRNIQMRVHQPESCYTR
jgi:hypothetical protein